MAYDDVVTVQVDVTPEVTTRLETDGTSVTLNVGSFSDSFLFEVPSGAVTDATFEVTVGGLAGVLPNATAVLEVQTDTGWVRVGDASQGGVLDLLTVAGRGFTVTAEDLQAGNYRLTYGGGGTLGIGTTVNLTAELADTSLTNFEVVSAPAVTGNVFAASDAGLADERGPGDGAVLEVLVGGTYVAVTAGTEVTGEFGILEINPDGSFTYTPDVEAGDIGQVDSFGYRLTGPDGSSEATLNVRLDSPDADIIWDDIDFGAPGTAVVAVGDTAEAGIVLGPRVGDPTTNANAIGYTSVLTGGRDTYDFAVSENTTADFTLDVRSSSVLNLLGNTTFTLQQFTNGRWVTVTDGSGGSLIDLVGLTGGGVRAVIDDLTAGSYRVTVSNGGLGLITTITGSATVQTTYLNELEARDVVATTGNVLTGADQDFLGSEQTVLRIEQGEGVYVAPGFGGERVVGDHGVLVIQANGDFTYTPFEDDAGIGETDRFTYQLVHPNGDAVTAELAVTIGQATADVLVAEEVQPNEAALLDLHADVVLLDGLTALSLSTDIGHEARLPSDAAGMTLPADDTGMPDPTLLELHGDTVVLAGVDDLSVQTGGEDTHTALVGLDGDGVTLPAFEDVLQIEPVANEQIDPSATPDAADNPHVETAVAVEIEPVILVESPLHDPWANAASHV
ncbi:BapA/Bap/LapF family large adhesin [Sphingomonas desiccabilis]|uniref:BapA/Bap/LapF family large adhesin n=1 Tax=Sphingomonas desiccabilis TaxID=429134 RepID=UPI0016221632|nr:BapA/Bap/LapF family large adhesin [Sphingomonas desiccabilis]MBB3912743.1 hypothetical protein [Sphingomonas desiccabilis]